MATSQNINVYFAKENKLKSKNPRTQKPTEKKKENRTFPWAMLFLLGFKVKSLRHVLGIQLYTASLNLPAQGVMSYKKETFMSLIFIFS